MHQAAEQAAEAQRELASLEAQNVQLRDRMAAILVNPMFQPITARPEYMGSPSEDPVELIRKEYQAAPNDEAAFRVLVERTRGLALGDIHRQLASRAADNETARRATAQSQALWHEIDNAVAHFAPDVPRDLFWMCSREAQARTPPVVVDPAVKLEWQVGEAIRLARAHRDEWFRPYQEQGQQAEALTRQAQVITPVRAASPTPAAAAQPRSFIDTLKAIQTERLAGAPR